MDPERSNQTDEAPGALPRTQSSLGLQSIYLGFMILHIAIILLWAVGYIYAVDPNKPLPVMFIIACVLGVVTQVGLTAGLLKKNRLTWHLARVGSLLALLYLTLSVIALTLVSGGPTPVLVLPGSLFLTTCVFHNILGSRASLRHFDVECGKCAIQGKPVGLFFKMVQCPTCRNVWQ